MFIVWGTKGFIKNLGATVHEAICPNCNNLVRWQGVEVGKRFSLFWIPLFKISSQRYITCPVCNTGQPILKDALDQQLLSNQPQQPVLESLDPSSPPQLPQETFAPPETAYEPYKDHE